MTIRLAAVLAVLTISAHAQTTWYVDVNGMPPGSGTPQDPFTSIQAAISATTTAPGDTVLVLPGVYGEVVDFLGKNINLRATAGSGQTIIDGQSALPNLVRFVSGEGPSATIDGFTIRGGTGSTLFPNGGGVVCASSDPVVSNCVIEACSAAAGGGVSLVGSSAQFISCTIEGNQGASGGGGIDIDSSNATFTACTIALNQAADGSGIRSSSSSTLFFDCVLRDNGPIICSQGGVVGGGFLGQSSSPTFLGCTVRNNNASVSGGIRCDGGDLTLVETVIEDNCSGMGGGVHIVGGTLSMTECTVDSNRAINGPGGGLLSEGAQLAIEDSAFRDNVAPDSHGGGGIWINSGSGTLTRCTIERNRSSNDGGGAWIQSAVVVSNSIIRDNLASCCGAGSENGGGIAGSALLERCIIARNRASDIGTGRGGGLYGPITAVQCVLWQNRATTDGAGAFDAILQNCVVWGNVIDDGYTEPVPNSLAGTGMATYSDVEGGWPGTGNIDTPPRFWGPPIDDFHLLPGSPCIDAGDPASPLDPDGSRADMGVYPFDPAYCGEPFTYCEGKANSLGCVPFITTTGHPSPTSTAPFEIIGNDVLPGEAGFMVYGFNKSMLGFHGGTLCVKAPIARVLPPKFAKANGAPPCTGRLRFDFNTRIQNGSDVLLMPGQTVYAQIHQRDPQDPSGFGDGLTDAVQFTICP